MGKFYIILSLILLSSCSKVDHLYVKGKDEQVIEKVIQKDRKNKVTKNDIIYLENAFHRKQEELLQAIDVQMALREQRKWVSVYYLTEELSFLQSEIQREQPIISKNGYEAQFDYYQISELQEEAKLHAANFYAEAANELLQRAKRYPNSHADAREAYTIYQKSETIDPARDYSSELREAKEYGQIRVYSEIETFGNGYGRYSRNRANREINQELRRMIQVQSSTWIIPVDDYYDETEIDYIVNVFIADIDFSRFEEDIERRNYTDEVRERLRNANGTYAVDSLGNFIYTTRTISAEIERRIYEQEVDVEVELQIIRANDQAIVYRNSFREDEEFREETCSIYGDEDALPNSVRCRNRNLDFPSESEMIEEVLEDMRYRVNQNLADNLLRIE